jgi:hypothetical protein
MYYADCQANSKSSQIQQNPAKSSKARPKKIKGKSLDFLGFSRPNRAFSVGCADPPGFFLLSPGWAASVVAPFGQSVGQLRHARKR